MENILEQTLREINYTFDKPWLWEEIAEEHTDDYFEDDEEDDNNE